MAPCKNEHNKSQVALSNTFRQFFYSNICWANNPLVVIITQSCQWCAEQNKKKNIMETCNTYCLVLSFSLFIFFVCRMNEPRVLNEWS